MGPQTFQEGTHRAYDIHGSQGARTGGPWFQPPSKSETGRILSIVRSEKHLYKCSTLCTKTLFLLA